MRAPEASRPRFPRARLVERLDRVRPGSVVLITAPSGYGKTDLLLAWSRASQVPAIRLTLRPHHDAPGAFVAALADALAPVGAEPTIGQPLSQSHAPAADASAAVAGLLDQLARRRLLLLLDDVHRLTSSEALGELDALVAGLPRSCVLALAGRRRLPLATAKRAMEGSLLVVEADQLLLTADTVGAVAGLSRSQVDRALELTGGWPAGFGMLTVNGAAAPHGPDVAGPDGAGLDAEGLVEAAIQEALLADLDPHLLAFLRDAAVLGSADVEVLDRARQASDARKLVEHLRTQPLPMVSITGRDLPLLRVSGLLRATLRREAEREDPQRVRDLLSIAAAVWEMRQDVLPAHDALTRLGDKAALVAFLTRVGPFVILEGRIPLVAQWLEAFGGEDVNTFPELPFLHSMVEGVSGNFDLTQRWLKLLDNHQVSDIIQAQLKGELNPNTVARQTLNFTTVGDEVEQASTSTSWWAIVSQLTMATAAFSRGDVEMARGILQLLEPFTRDVHLADSWRFALLALVQARAGRHDQARAQLVRWQTLIDEYGLRAQPTTVGLECAWAVYAVHDGDREAALAHYADAMVKLRRLAPGIALHLIGVAAPLALAMEYVDIPAAREITTLLVGLPVTAPEAPALVPELQELAARLERVDPTLDAAGLSPAEAKVLAQLATHLPVPKIAEELFLSPATVRTHAANIYRKLGVHSRSEAVEAARARGLLT